MLCVVKDGGVRAGQKVYRVGETVELSDSEAERLWLMDVVSIKSAPTPEPEPMPEPTPEQTPKKKKGRGKNGR